MEKCPPAGTGTTGTKIRFPKNDLSDSKEFLYRANGHRGFGSQTAAEPPWQHPTTAEKQTVDTVAASQKMLTLQALSSSRNAGTAKRGCLGRGKAFG